MPSKYHNIKTAYRGEMYDSKKEAEFAMLLDSLKRARDPSEKVWIVERQVPFEIVINNKKICKYIADFRVQYHDGHFEIIDVKGMKTAIYRLKKKLVEAQYGIEIKER